MNVLKLAEEDGCTGRKVSTRKGGEYHGPCPGCGGKDRFLIWPEQNGGEGSWWCRICGQGGDLIQYLREFRGMSFKDAAAMSSRPTSPKAPGAAPKPQAFVPRAWSRPRKCGAASPMRSLRGRIGNCSRRLRPWTCWQRGVSAWKP
ncbi:hypothetical protein LWC08_03815 [Desulfobaculum bizertense]|uniref:primase-helicase zinc-binding domain-containing protein n=1 Tax=Desulfobaculum bizertense TaxID=376490 RepID=UPI001F382140|nr:primase-helicase zinc-binding domain-containing protein [Desulfobaculum bizertense]UIJ38705.1 hypothetical protein LWC08_03815 [Desulfobaculum bizertense]